MHKSVKIVGKVLSTTILLLIVIPFLLSVLLGIPAVQTFVVQKAARMASEKLQTTVSIGRVDISYFGKVKVQKFYVEDYQRDTLLYVDRLDAYLTGLGIFGGGLQLNRAEIVGAKLYLRETPDGTMNISQVVSRLSNPNSTSPNNFQLSLKNASVEKMDFCLERLVHDNPAYGIDFSHMHLYDIVARIDDFAIDGQAIYTTIQSLSTRERSGFVLAHLSGRFYLTSGCLGFEQASIVTDKSNITLPYISLVGNSWDDYKDFIGEVRMDGALRNATISTDDIAYFAPRLQDWHTTFSDVNIEVAGVVSDFTGTIRSLRIGEGTSMTAEVTIQGLPDIEKTHFDLFISHLTTSADEIDLLAQSIAGKSLPAKSVEMLRHGGKLELNARYQGMFSSFDMQLGLETALGEVHSNLRVRPLHAGRRSVQGNVSTPNFRLGQLLGRTDLLGNATLSARVDGVVGANFADAKVVANVTKLGFKGYVYDSLRCDGRLRNRAFDGRVTARDPNLNFDFTGAVDLNDLVPQYDFTMDLRHADLVKLHINPRDSISQLTARINANASGRSFDDMNGNVHISDVIYRYNDKQVTNKSIVITGENSEQSKFVELRSDFADVTFRSKTSYRTVFEYLRQSAWKYLPMLSRDGLDVQHRESTTAVADDYSLLSVTIKEINPIIDAVASGLQIADGSSLQLLFNPASDQLSLKATSEYIERKQLLATRLNITASNRGDSLAVYASAEDLYAGALHLPHLSVMGGAKQGRMQLSTGFEDTVRKLSGLLSLRAQIANENGPNGRVIELQILPSHITRGDKTWQIFAHKILLDTAQVNIQRFFVMNREQELLIDGIASRSRNDSVMLTLKNFDLAPFSQIADRMGYFIEGRTNGSATMKSVMRGGEVTADILLDSVRVNNILAPPLRLSSRWDFARNRAGVALMNRVKRDTLIQGFYAPDQVRYYARLTVDSLEMSLLDPVLSGVISSTRGLASADLVVQGQQREANLTGSILVTGLSTKVDFTQVTYTLSDALIEVRNNHFRAANIPIFDPEGNRGRFDIDLNLQHLSNIAYDVHVAPQQMLVLNTTAQDNDLFYGKVFATGTARISGDKGGVNMDISATTAGHSTFSMPLSGRANISNADFVVFEQPIEKDSLDNLSRRKLMFERVRRQQTDEGSQMNISLALDVQPNTEVELSVSGNAIKARGEGSLNMQINPQSKVFEMYGDYMITDGSYNFSLQNIINKRFIIENGSMIQWTGSPMDAMLNIDALYKVKASLQPLLQGTADNLASDRSVPVECIIHLGDRLTNPAVTFDVRVPGSDPETQSIVANALNTPESVDMQFLYLLLFNSFLAENNAAAGSNIGASVSAATGLEFLTNQLSNWLSADDYNVVIRYRPKSELTSDEVDFGLSKSLINNRLFVEVEGNYLIDNKQAVNNSMSNFMGEAYVTYLIDRSGALKLKAFTQTIDRFDENQGLQETGIGIYYKEDFNNFRDLRHRVQERFTNKKRKARREARAVEKAAVKRRADSAHRVQAGDTLPIAQPVQTKTEDLNK